jgi:hypothetical protein
MSYAVMNAQTNKQRSGKLILIPAAELQNEVSTAADLQREQLYAYAASCWYGVISRLCQTRRSYRNRIPLS